jgi:hypothetical protein
MKMPIICLTLAAISTVLGIVLSQPYTLISSAFFLGVYSFEVWLEFKKQKDLEQFTEKLADIDRRIANLSLMRK